MKVAFFSFPILEIGGGLAKYFIETSVNLENIFPLTGCSIVVMDEACLQKVRRMLAIYNLNKVVKRGTIMETTEKIVRKLGTVNYIKCSSIKFLKEELNKYDLIYSKNELVEAFILKFLIGYKNLPPVIFGCHTPAYYPVVKSIQSKLHNILYGGVVYKFLASGVNIFHVINSFDEKFYKKLFQSKKVVKIYNPFDSEQFLRSADANKYGFKRDKAKHNIIWAGRLTEQKGVDDLVMIVNRINSTPAADKIVWNICGDGGEKYKIVDLLKWKNVNYFGYVENIYMASLYKENDLFISTSKWEGFPYNLLEAQSCGLPVIAYDICGCNDMVESGVNGYLVTNAEQYGTEILNCVSGKYVFSGIKQYIMKKFNSNSIYSELASMFAGANIHKFDK